MGTPSLTSHGERLPEASFLKLLLLHALVAMPKVEAGRLWGGSGYARALQGACTLAHICHLQQQEWQRPHCGD